jgi:hypothetical protein
MAIKELTRMNKPKLLKARHTIELVPTAPFNFDATLHKPDRFPAADTQWEPGTRWQTMRWQGKPLGLRFENQGTVVRPRIALSIWSASAALPLSESWRNPRHRQNDHSTRALILLRRYHDPQ